MTTTPALVSKQLKQRPTFFGQKKSLLSFLQNPGPFAILPPFMNDDLEFCPPKSILEAPDVKLFSGAFHMDGLKSLLISVVNANFSDTQKSS